MNTQEKIKFDHVAIHTSLGKMKETVEFYRSFLNGKVLYQDETWSLIEGSGVKVALVVPSQHPPHIGFFASEEEYEKYISEGRVFKKHRDGSESFYLKDPSGNFLEVLYNKKPYSQKIKSAVKKKVMSIIGRI